MHRIFEFMIIVFFYYKTLQQCLNVFSCTNKTNLTYSVIRVNDIVLTLYLCCFLIYLFM